MPPRARLAALGWLNTPRGRGRATRAQPSLCPGCSSSPPAEPLIPPRLAIQAHLSFSVWDHDKIGMNDSLGVGEVLLTQCVPGVPTPLTIALSTQGAIEVVVTYSSTGESAPAMCPSTRDSHEQVEVVGKHW